MFFCPFASCLFCHLWKEAGVPSLQMALGSESSWRTRLVLEERGRRRRRRLEGGIIVAKVVEV